MFTPNNSQKKVILTPFLVIILLIPLWSQVIFLGNVSNSTISNEPKGCLSEPSLSIDPPTMPISSRGLKATGPVAILEDADPWGYNNVETILLSSGTVVVDTIPSASFGAYLGDYQKVIISSDQDAAFYSAVESYRNWLEGYVREGGILEVHAARLSTYGDWILPGGYGHVLNITENVDFADSGHYLLHNPLEIYEVDLENWGNSAHAYFNNTEGTSVILTNGIGEPVLIEARYGLGYIIATTQPLEWGYSHEGSDFLENVVWYIPTHESPSDGALTGSVAILQDTIPWEFTHPADSTQQILTMHGISYDVITSGNFGTVDLSAYQKVVISADQAGAFYTALDTHRTWLENYMNGGGILEVHAATQGWDWILPGGFGCIYSGTSTINIIHQYHYTLYHPYWIREPELTYWDWSTHGHFNETAGATVILTDGADPVLFEQAIGDGFIIATAQTLEFGSKPNNNYSRFLENLLLYVPHQQVTPQPNDYINMSYTDLGSGDYGTIDCVFENYLDDWRINMTAHVQRFHSDDTMYEDLTYWLALHTGTRYCDDGTMWWVGSYFLLMTPTTGLTIGSIFPIWISFGIVVDEVDHIWVNGLTYECWNVSFDYGNSFVYVEKTSGLPLYQYFLPSTEGYITASNLVPQPPDVLVTYPNGGETLEDTITITWSASDPNDDTLTFDLAYWDGSSWVPLTTGHTSTNYLWDTTTVPNRNDYRIRVIAHDGTYAVGDESDGIFTIDNPTPTDGVPPPPWLWIVAIAVAAIVIIVVVVILVYLFVRRRGQTK